MTTTFRAWPEKPAGNPFRYSKNQKRARQNQPSKCFVHLLPLLVRSLLRHSQTYRKCDASAASVTRFTISQAVPHLVKLFMNPDEALTRPATMLLLSDLITAARDSSGQESESEYPSALSPYKDDVYTITMVALGNVSSRRAALGSLNGLVTTRALLSDDELGTIVNNINDLLQVETDGGDDTR